VRRAVVLVAHGTVDDLGDLPAFLANIRRGHPAPDSLVAELRRRYEAIGGSSPLNAINARLAHALHAVLGVPVKLANRLWAPYAKDVLATLDEEAHPDEIVALPLAQHSAHVYGQAIADAAKIPVRIVENWGQTPALLDAFAKRIRDALSKLPKDAGKKTALVLSAHSLPQSVIDAGDPYEREVRQSAAAVAERVRDVLPDVWVAFQSQGMSQGPGGKPMPWLGPDLPATFDAIAARGFERVIVAPIGFLADHVEILYDIDIEAKQLAAERGLSLTRTASLDDAPDFVAVLASLVRPLLEEAP
jgi:ferrochelatase